MTDNAQRPLLITRYLLGQLSPEDRVEIENHYVRDDDLFEELVAAENDLMDAYVSGKLGGADQKQFETYFLSTPERRERVEFARSVMKHGSPAKGALPGTPEVRRGWLDFGGASRQGKRLALATMLFLALAAVAWIAVANRKLSHQLATARAAQMDAQRQAEALNQRIAELKKQAAAAGQDSEIADLPAPGSAILSLTLAPNLVRGAYRQQSTLHLAPNVTEVRLLLRTDDGHSLAYSAVLENVEGSRIWRANGLVARPALKGGKIIIVPIQPGILRADDYVLRLFTSAPDGGGAEMGTYSFRVAKR